jgi:group I intron endonuclease
MKTTTLTTKDRIFTIYLVTNQIDGKRYVGFDSKWPRRKYQHLKCNGSCPKFHSALEKHGLLNFEWEVLYQSKDGDHTLKVMEPYFIGLYNTLHEGYNLTHGGDAPLGLKFSAESKARLSAMRMGRKQSQATKDKISATKLAASPEQKAKFRETVRAALIGVPRPQEVREKVRLGNLGKKLSEETKEKMRKAKRA